MITVTYPNKKLAEDAIGQAHIVSRITVTLTGEPKETNEGWTINAFSLSRVEDSESVRIALSRLMQQTRAIGATFE